MQAFIGTSGYAYDHWKGELYPEDIKNEDMLACYAKRFASVEINNTYYRIPKADVVRHWADAVPDDFRFVVKASRRITHFGRLGDVKDSLDYMLKQLEPLFPKLGPILFQCPPTMRKDVDRLRRFVSWLPAERRGAFEFRHASWHADDVYDVLRESKHALALSDDAPFWDGETLVPTTDFGFVRLRGEEYDDASLDAWGERLAAKWDRVFAFFKHEELGPALATRLTERLQASSTS